MKTATKQPSGTPTTATQASGCADPSWMKTDGVEPSVQYLERVILLKHADPETYGRGPRIRRLIRLCRKRLTASEKPANFGGRSPRFRCFPTKPSYFNPDEAYVATAENLVKEGCAWLDIGCRLDFFPDNRSLAALLASRCQILVGVDPDDNPHVHERAKTNIDRYQTDLSSDVVTLRAVAEHITDPDTAAASLARLTRPGGKVIVYNVNKWSPVALAAKAITFGLRHTIKWVLWKTDKGDTFPVAYRMKTRSALEHEFRESTFAYIDDCRDLGRFRPIHAFELGVWKQLKALHARYTKYCLLGIYERAETLGVTG